MTGGGVTTPLHPAVRWATIIAVVAVALIAAIVSYSHMQQLAYGVGEDWRSWLIPISIEGLVVAASMTLLTRHRAGLPVSYLGWGALGGGVVASVAANMASARPVVTAVLVAGWAPVAFAICFKLLLLQRRAERHVTDGAHSTSAPTGTVRQNQPEPPTKTLPTPTAIAPTVSVPTTAVPAPNPATATPAPSTQPPPAPTPAARRGTTAAPGHSNTEWARGVTRPTRERATNRVTDEEWAQIDRLLDAGSDMDQEVGILDEEIAKRTGFSSATIKKRRLERNRQRVQRNGDGRMVRQ